MRVCMITGSYPPMKSGAADPIHKLCCHLAVRSIDVDVITAKGIPPAGADSRISVYPMANMYAWDTKHLIAAVRIITRTRPDVVNLQYQGALYGRGRAVTMLPLLIKCLRPSTGVVTNFEYPQGARPLPQWLSRQPFLKVLDVLRCHLGWFDPEYGTLLSCSDVVIAQSEDHRVKLVAALPSVEEKTVIIPWGSSTTAWGEEGAETKRRARQHLGLPLGSRIVCFYGYLYPGKGLETLLQAFAALPGSNSLPDVRLLVIGGGENFVSSIAFKGDYQAHVRNLAGELGIADRVEWTGYCPTWEPTASMYLRASDICVLPYDTGVCLNKTSVATAVSHGLPLITTQGRFSDADFVAGVNVLFCPPRDAPSLAAAMTRLLSSPGLCAALSRGAQKLHDERFSWDRIVGQTLEAYGVAGDAAQSGVGTSQQLDPAEMLARNP